MKRWLIVVFVLLVSVVGTPAVSAQEVHPQFAYLSDTFDKLFLYDVQTGQSSLLYEELEGNYVYQPSWSPDGQLLAFGLTSNEDGIITGCDIKLLSETMAVETLIHEPEKCLSEPTWSPDGTKLAYLSHAYQSDTVDVRIYDFAEGKSQDIFSMEASYFWQYHMIVNVTGGVAFQKNDQYRASDALIVVEISGEAMMVSNEGSGWRYDKSRLWKPTVYAEYVTVQHALPPVDNMDVYGDILVFTETGEKIAELSHACDVTWRPFPSN